MLHLIDPSNPGVGPCAAAMLGDLAGAGATRRVDLLALIVGGSGDEALARALGVRTHDRLASLGGWPWLGVGGLRRYLAAVGPVDLLHCWSISTLAMTMLVAPGVPRVLSLAAEPIDREQGRWLRAAQGSTRAPLTILPTSNNIKRAWAAAGVEPSMMHVVRPGLDLTRLHSAARAPLRQDWGVASADTTVVLVLTQNGASIDAWRVASLLACGSASGLDLAFIVPADSAHRSTARSLAQGIGRRDRLVFDARLRRPWEVLPAGDVVLVLGDDTASLYAAGDVGGAPAAIGGARAAARSLLRGPRRVRPGQVVGVTPMLWAAAAGKVVIAEAGYAVSEVVENGKTALVVKPGDHAAIIERLREVIGDRHRAWSLSDTARSEAYSFFSVSRYAENTVGVYEQVLGGRPIDIPAMPLTGGLAFAGRQ